MKGVPARSGGARAAAGARQGPPSPPSSTLPPTPRPKLLWAAPLRPAAVAYLLCNCFTLCMRPIEAPARREQGREGAAGGGRGAGGPRAAVQSAPQPRVSHPIDLILICSHKNTIQAQISCSSQPGYVPVVRPRRRWLGRAARFVLRALRAAPAWQAGQGRCAAQLLLPLRLPH